MTSIKIKPIILSLSVAILAGCGGGGGQSSQPSPVKPSVKGAINAPARMVEGETYSVGVSLSSADHNLTAGAVDGNYNVSLKENNGLISCMPTQHQMKVGESFNFSCTVSDENAQQAKLEVFADSDDVGSSTISLIENIAHVSVIDDQGQSMEKIAQGEHAQLVITTDVDNPQATYQIGLPEKWQISSEDSQIKAGQCTLDSDHKRCDFPLAVASDADIGNQKITLTDVGENKTKLDRKELAISVVPQPIKWSSISAGLNFNCAIDSVGQPYCWGENVYGQLGNNSTTTSYIPVKPNQIEDITSLSAGSFHACAVNNSGEAYCWGKGKSGQLGNGDIKSSPEPIKVNQDRSVKFQMVSSGGEFSCALDQDKKAYCWGSNSMGQLGLGTTTNMSEPTVLSFGSEQVLSISAGTSHACAITQSTTNEAKSVMCWGSNAQGQLGLGNTTAKVLSPKAMNLDGINAKPVVVKAGNQYTCVGFDNNTLYCTGSNKYGQLGQKDKIPTSTNHLIKVENLENIQSFSVGNYHTCAMDNNNKAWCWGTNDKGQLGNGTFDQANVPSMVIGDSYKAIANGNQHSCAITPSATIQCWGDDSKGQLGVNPESISDKKSNKPLDIVTA
ncbi:MULTISPECIES: RCC1 domain-containing protein [Cysteiniphilum]|uniref:RCC1 domain-containing protein n=1 Tax=Cysteiniphilum TaxID=2056696 RepID=UPI00177D3D58|nr:MULTISPECIES: hypothetical protein [Cysteiniphilum]